MLKWRRFDLNDWVVFAGAEKFANGADPAIAEISVETESGRKVDGLVVVDPRGAEIWMCDDGDYAEAYFCADDSIAFFGLRPEETETSLAALGFRRG